VCERARERGRWPRDRDRIRRGGAGVLIRLGGGEAAAFISWPKIDGGRSSTELLHC
jgi:hypothetical protein